MVTRDEFEKARQVIQDYTAQVNKDLIGSRLCICCKTKEIKPLEGMGLSEGYIKATEQEQGAWDGGTVEKISFGYGSHHDLRVFYIAFCDECIDKLEKEGLIIDAKTLRKQEKEYGLTL